MPGRGGGPPHRRRHRGRRAEHASAATVAEQVIVKLNEGSPGAGNAMVDLHGLPARARRRKREVIATRVRSMQPEAENLPSTSTWPRSRRRRHRRGTDHRSRTAQSERPDAGAAGRHRRAVHYSRPASGRCERTEISRLRVPGRIPRTPLLIAEPAMVIGRHLAKLGVLGRFAVDFVVVQDESGDVDAVRDRAQPPQGRYHPPVPDLAVPHRRHLRRRPRSLPDPDGPQKYLVATDHFEDARLRALTVDELFDVVVDHGLHFDQARQTGVVFHMISCLTECGRVGLTAVGDTPERCVADLRGGAGRAPAGGGGCTRGRSRRRLNPPSGN